jgi:tRNA A-37 threonylcarbamoyl transferase component Bud32
MSTRELVLRVPASWTDAEVEERLRRLRAPAETEEQRAKSAAQVEIQTRTLARVVVDVDQLNERVETVEARGLQMVDRGELEQIRAIVDDAMARMHEIDTVAHDARAAWVSGRRTR